MPDENYLKELARGEQQIQQFSRAVNTESNAIVRNLKKIASGGKEVVEFGLDWHPATVALSEFSRASTEAAKNAKGLQDTISVLRKGGAQARVNLLEYRAMASAAVEAGGKMQKYKQAVDGTTSSLNKLGTATKWAGEQFKWIAPNTEEAVKASEKLLASNYRLVKVMGSIGGKFAKVFLNPITTSLAAASLSYDLFIKKAIDSSERLEKKLMDVGFAIEAAGGGRGAGAGQAALMAEAALRRGGYGRLETVGAVSTGIRRGFGVAETGQLVDIARTIATEQGKALGPVLDTVLNRAAIQRIGLTSAQREQQRLDWRLRAGPIAASAPGPFAVAGRAFTEFGGRAGAIERLVGYEFDRLARRIAGPLYRREAHPLRRRLAEALPGGAGPSVFGRIGGTLGAGVAAVTDPLLKQISDVTQGYISEGARKAAVSVGIQEKRPAPSWFNLPAGSVPEWQKAAADWVKAALGGGITTGFKPGERRLQTPGSWFTPDAGTTRYEKAVDQQTKARNEEEKYLEILQKDYELQRQRRDTAVKSGGVILAQLEEAKLEKRALERYHGPAQGQGLAARRELAVLSRGAEGRGFTSEEKKRFDTALSQLNLGRDEIEFLRKNKDTFKKTVEEVAENITKLTAKLAEADKKIIGAADATKRLGEAIEKSVGRRPAFMGERTLSPGELITGITQKSREFYRTQGTVYALEQEKEIRGALTSEQDKALREGIKRLQELDGELKKLQKSVSSVDKQYVGLRQRLKEQAQTVYYPKGAGIEIRGLAREGAISGGEASEFLKYVKVYADTGFRDLRDNLDKLLKLRKGGYDQEIQATAQFADLRLQIVREHYNAIIKLDRARLAAPDRADRFRLGYAQQVAGIETARTGIVQTRRGAAREAEDRAITQERFQRGQATQFMSLMGIQMPRGMQMAMGLRELQIQRQQRDRDELDRAKQLGDAVDKFSNTMLQVGQVGLTPGRLMKSEAGRQFYGQQLQELLPAASRLGFGESVGGKLRGVLGARQRFALQTMQFGEREREVRLQGSGASLEELNRQFEGRQEAPEYLYRRAQLLRERRDLLAGAGRPQEAAQVQAQFMETYSKLSVNMQKALTDKQEAIKNAIEMQTNVVKSIYDFLTGKKREPTAGGPAREYSRKFGPGALLEQQWEDDRGGLVAGPFKGVTPYKGPGAPKSQIPGTIGAKGIEIPSGTGGAVVIPSDTGGAGTLYIPSGPTGGAGPIGATKPLTGGPPTAQDSPDEWARKFLSQPHVKKLQEEPAGLPGAFTGGTLSDYMGRAGAAIREAGPHEGAAAESAMWGVATQGAYPSPAIEATKKRIQGRETAFMSANRFYADLYGPDTSTPPILQSPDLPPMSSQPIPRPPDKGPGRWELYDTAHAAGKEMAINWESFNANLVSINDTLKAGSKVSIEVGIGERRQIGGPGVY